MRSSAAADRRGRSPRDPRNDVSPMVTAHTPVNALTRARVCPPRCEEDHHEARAARDGERESKTE